METVKLSDEETANLPRLVRSGRVQALLLIGQLEPRYRKALAADAYSAGFQIDTVISDGYYGMDTMTDHLLRHGHRKIAYVGSVGATSSITDRYFSYCRALQEWGISVRQ